MPITIRETRGATVAPSTSGRLKVGLVTPGLGTSGFYSQQVLENAATDKVWPKGTKVFFDHPSESEQRDRPERSVRDLAAVTREDAYWDGEGLVAEADVIGPYRDLVTDPVFAENVGMSIRATAEARAGEVDGKPCTVITRLVEGLSVDLVTQAGRGGRILAVLESARATLRRASEATANDTREALGAALQAAYGGEGVWLWVRDFDDTTVWFTYETNDASAMYAQAYTLDDQGAATLTGDRTEVRAHTVYVPVTPPPMAVEGGPHDVSAPAGQPQSPNPQSEEDNMGSIQVDEALHASLTEAAGRVPTLETELAAANQRATAAEQKLRERDTTDTARAVITREATAGGVEFTALECRGLLAGLPTTEQGLDEPAFTETVKVAVAEKKATRTGATLTGFGVTTPTASDVIAEAEKAVAAAFGRHIKEA